MKEPFLICFGAPYEVTMELGVSDIFGRPKIPKRPYFCIVSIPDIRIFLHPACQNWSKGAILTLLMKITWSLLLPWIGCMNPRTCVTSNDRGEPAVSYKWTDWVWEITCWSWRLQENYRSFRGIYRIYPNLTKDNRRMCTCNRLDL